MADQTPTLITYADENVEHYIPYLTKACDKLGYPLQVYTPETAQFDRKILELPWTGKQAVKGLSLSPQKPNVILQALDELQTPIIWLDTDAFPIADLEIDWSFDCAFTLRPNQGPSMWDGLCNAGVNLYNNTEGARTFLQELIEEIPHTEVKSDQEAINVCLTRRGWDRGYGDYDLGIQVRILPTEEWNNFHFPNVDRARILHFKTPHKDKYAVYHQRFV